MKRLVAGLVLAVCCSYLSGAVTADIVDFRLTGNGGEGLLDTNVTPPTGSAGEGGIGLSGITLDTDNNILHVDIDWGTANGYAGDLTGPVTKLHLHGPTPANAPDSFSQTGPLMVTLSSSLSFNSSGINGGVNDDFFINSSDMQAILDGRTYINVHTDAFEFGEIRGYLVAAVPEPGTTGLVLAGAIFVGLRRRRHR
ncbi:MAG: CHRD domain-containing protein [Planctomycetaceae bacterium]|nr:CHRD domain-containing protein [Planctomycetaceae bacterium]MCP4464884.1 CHRD domain-containing protein [Planctomycetaceae bacterium]MDG1807089.1 CHRD domain-containing protein [Pirellulaceae bacterium]